MDQSDASSHGQVNPSAAEIYETFFVPALFGQWSERLLDSARLQPDDHVLDVGCGTGVLARAAARRLAGSGSVTGLDINEGMLSVARRAAEPVTWRRGKAEHLPFPDRSFDRVVSQFALMFFADQQGGLSEMRRVTRPGGTVTVATWASIDRSPGYAAMVALLRRLFGDEPADALMAPFSIGTEAALADLIRTVLPDAVVTVHDGVARFTSLEAWVHTDIRGWTLANMIDEQQHAELLRAAERELASFVGRDGTVSFAAPALIATATAPEGESDR